MSKSRGNTDWIYDIVPICAGVHVETSWQSDTSSIVTHWIMSSSALPPLLLSTYMWTSVCDGEHQASRRRPCDVLSRYFQQLQRTTKKSVSVIWNVNCKDQRHLSATAIPFCTCTANLYTHRRRERPACNAAIRQVGFWVSHLGNLSPSLSFFPSV